MGKKKLKSMDYLSLEETCEGVDYGIVDNSVLVGWAGKKPRLIKYGSMDEDPTYINQMIYFVKNNFPLYMPTSVRGQFLSNDKKRDCISKGGSFICMWRAREKLVKLLEEKNRIIDVHSILNKNQYQKQMKVIKEKDFYKFLEPTDRELFAISLFFSRNNSVALFANDGDIINAYATAMNNGYSKRNFKVYRRVKKLNPCFQLATL